MALKTAMALSICLHSDNAHNIAGSHVRYLAKFQVDMHACIVCGMRLQEGTGNAQGPLRLTPIEGQLRTETPLMGLGVWCAY